MGDGKDYRDRTAKLLPPLKEEGAYLVACRGKDLDPTGLALVTPLVVEAQEEPESGRVRATVKDVVTGKYVPDAQVRVIGSRNQDFVAGATDLRGVFVADGINGRSTVLARAPAGYAFHRGLRELGAAPQQVEARPQQSAAPQIALPPNAPASGANADGGADLLKNIRSSNSATQQLQCDQLDNLYKSNRKGVAPAAAK